MSFTDDAGLSAQQIKTLAARDGWRAVYEPSDPATVVLDQYGRVTEIHDGLGNEDPLTAYHGAPQLLRNEFGHLNGVEGGNGVLAVDFLTKRSLPQPNTIITVARNATTEQSQRFMIDGVGTRRHAIDIKDAPGTPVELWAGHQSASAAPLDTRPHVFTAYYDTTRSQLNIDGRFAHQNTPKGSNQRLGGLTVAGDHAGARQWIGSVGPVLIYDGKAPREVVHRMESLLFSLTGIPRRAPQFPRASTVYSINEHGHETLVHGDPDRVIDQPGGVASITKLMTCWVARQVLHTDDLLDQTFEVTTADHHSYGGSRFRTGDILTYRDMIFAAMLPSDNKVPFTIARGVGQILDPEASDPVGRFVAEMNTTASALGYKGAEFATPWNHGRMSAVQVADLHRRIMADNFLLEATGTRVTRIQVTGANPRRIRLRHTAERIPTRPIDEMVSAKTGTWPAPSDGRGHLSLAWNDDYGVRHTTVIFNTGLEDARYDKLRKVIDATSGRAGEPAATIL